MSVECDETFDIHKDEMFHICKVSQKARLIGCYGGAVDSIISVNTQLHWSSYDLEFEISFESI